MTQVGSWIGAAMALILLLVPGARDGHCQELELSGAEVSATETLAAGTVAIGPSVVVTETGTLNVFAGSVAIRPHFAVAAGGALHVVIRALARPDLFSPPEAAQDVPALVSFAWGSVDGATAYNLQVAADELFSSVVVDEPALSSTTFEFALAPMTDYYWRVRGIDLPTVGSWSGTRSFSTATNVGIEDDDYGDDDAQYELDLRIYPNPIGAAAIVNVELPSAGNVDLSVYDLLGRRVAQLHSGPMERGITEIAMSRLTLATGVYYARLDAGGASVVRTLVLE